MGELKHTKTKCQTISKGSKQIQADHKKKVSAHFN